MKYNILARKLLDISSEPILKLRQKKLLTLLEKDEDDVVLRVISLSLALRARVTITLRANISEKPTNFSEFLGIHTFYYEKGDRVKLRNSLKGFDQDWQVIAQFVFGDKFKLLTGLYFLYDNLPRIYTLEELKEDFLLVPEGLGKVTKVTLKSHNSSTKIHYPFRLFQVNGNIRRRAKLFYYVKVGVSVSTNITSIKVKRYLEASLIHKYNYGVILVSTALRGRDKILHIQPLVHSSNTQLIMDIYKGVGVSEEDLASIYNTGDGLFKNAPTGIVIHYARSTVHETIHSVSQVSGATKDGHYILHTGGFTKLTYKRTTHYAQVVGYVLNKHKEPIGLKLVENEIEFEVLTTVPAHLVSQGLDNTYVKLSKIHLNDELVTSHTHKVLNKNYKMCPGCGNVAASKPDGLCWVCSSKIFRKAVVNGGVTRYEEDYAYHLEGFTTTVYKFDVEFVDGKIVFKENLSNWEGRQLYLPSDWWG